MDFSLTDEQATIRDTFQAFADREVRPAAAKLDANPRFPRELFEQAGALGFFAMRYPEPEGGGADLISYLLAVEELARGSLGVAASCTMQSLMGTHFVHRFAQGEVRERLLVPALAGRVVGAICMTEPDAGSDLFAISTRAEQRDGRWFVSGRKTWVTSAPAADMFTVFARTGEKALSVFLVERGADGLAVGRDIGKMGVRTSVTSEVAFEDTPATCLLGELGQGTAYLRELLVEIRLMTAALALGVGRAAYEDARIYAHERVQFGRTIEKFQAVQAHLAETVTDLEAARHLVYYAAWRQEQGLPNVAQANMAKLFTSEAAWRACDKAARVFASYGFATDYPVERYLRDVRFTLIGGGTSEILKINIARELAPVSSTPPIRVLIAKPGLDGHDVGARIVCRALMDAGMEVIYTGLRQAPEAIAATARDEDVDVIGLSILSGAHLPLARKVVAALSAHDVQGKLLLVGGNIPAEDCPALEALGVDVALPTGTTLDRIVATVRAGVPR